MRPKSVDIVQAIDRLTNAVIFAVLSSDNFDPDDVLSMQIAAEPDTLATEREAASSAIIERAERA